MQTEYAFFPGCVLTQAAKESKMALEAVAPRLGIKLKEIPGWSCCGASQAQDVDPVATLVANARNLALAEIATRLLKPQRLSANAVAALCSVLVGQLEAGKGGRFLFPNAKPDKRPVGRPRCAKKKSTLWLSRYPNLSNKSPAW